MRILHRSTVNRRTFLKSTAATGLAAFGDGLAMPSLSRAGDRPVLTHAGTFGPGKLDNTFGPQLRYVKAPSEEQGQNLPPSMGLQFFGHVRIDGETGVMTVTLRDVADAALWSTDLEPRLG